MSAYNKKHNSDDITIRNITVGLVKEFDKGLTLVNIRKDKREEIKIPFYYSSTGDERFMQDFFLNDPLTDPDGRISETDIHRTPYGLITLNGLKTIRTDSITNKFVRGSYLKEDEEGELKTYTANLFSIPILLNYNIEIRISTVTDQFKVAEVLVREYFKNRTFHVNVNNVVIACTMKLPETFEGERTMEFGFDTDKIINITFSIDVESYMAHFDSNTEIFIGNRISEGVQNNLIITKGLRTEDPINPLLGETRPMTITPIVHSSSDSENTFGTYVAKSKEDPNNTVISPRVNDDPENLDNI
jgi:hypothetical protein